MRGRLVTDAGQVMDHRSTEMVPLGSLGKSDSPRLSGEDEEHVRLLAESDAELPPILVNRRTMRVVDGTHRVLAAALRGQHEIEVDFCECDDEEAFVLAVEANVAHGLALSLSDRTSAAERIIASHTQWSDRAIASVTGLAHKTVGSIRRRASGEIPQSATRRGRDGRVRPIDAREGRLQAGKLLADRPDASLREIAKEAGICPATVRDVRARLRRGEAPVLPVQRTGGSAQPKTSGTGTSAATPLRPKAVPGKPDAAELSALIHNLRKDPSLRFSESGRTLLRLLEAAGVEPQEWTRISENVPTHCVEIIAAAARECSQAWQEFATDLERRRRRQSSG
jgi:ParB-like chromosome segregation protein Spo0J